MNLKRKNLLPYVISTLSDQPQAYAHIFGSPQYASIQGNVYFYQISLGVLVAAEVFGLPQSDENCMEKIFGFHIHGGHSCTGNETDPFADTGTHFAIAPCTKHPYHAGDLPPLFGNDGTAFLITLTDRFSIKEILGKTIIIHSQADDFASQPGGNAGQKMACGMIRNNSY